MSLSWQHLADQLVNLGMNPNAIAIVGGKVMIDPGAITGDVHDSLDDQLVLEFLVKFVNLCSQAQTIYNENNLNPIAVINAAFNSNPITEPNGNMYIVRTQSFQVRLNIDTNTVLGVN